MSTKGRPPPQAVQVRRKLDRPRPILPPPTAPKRRGRSARGLVDLMELEMSAKTPADLAKLERATSEYVKRKAKESAEREAADRASGKHTSAAQWFAERPHLLTMLSAEHGLTAEAVDAAVLTFDEAEPYNWLHGPLGLMFSMEFTMHEEHETDEPTGGDWYERDARKRSYRDAPRSSPADVEVAIAEHIIRRADEIVQRRCDEYRVHGVRAPVPKPKRPRRTKEGLRLTKDAARKRAARAAGKVKPRPKRTRTTWQWFEQRHRALRTLLAKYRVSPLFSINKRQAEVIDRAVRAVTVWADRVEKYGPNHVWVSRADYYKANPRQGSAWLELDEWIAAKKASGKWVDWGLDGLKAELAEARAHISAR